MRRPLIDRCLRVLGLLLLVVGITKADAQLAMASKAPGRPTALSGLYRIEIPASGSVSVIRFIRLFPDGRNRIEAVQLDASGARLQAKVSVSPFHRNRWGLKEVSPERAPQLCFAINGADSCAAFHQEMPSGDLLLFAADANWGSPSLILRRQ